MCNSRKQDKGQDKQINLHDDRYIINKVNKIIKKVYSIMKFNLYIKINKSKY